MTDAELMTTAPDVPGVSLTIHRQTWSVESNGEYLGLVDWYPNSKQWYLATKTTTQECEEFQTRNAAVQWLLRSSGF